MRAVYGATRNLYPYLPMAIGSLLKYNPNMKVVLICEDDEIETCKHPNVEFININKLPSYFNENGPNCESKWTVMSFMEVILSKILPDDKVLWLDVDTLTLENLIELEYIDMDNASYAAVQEVPLANHRALDFSGKYTNSGVAILNLDFIRKHKLDDKMQEMINTQSLQYPDQDVLNYCCGDTIVYLPPHYNVSPFTIRTNMRPYIIHFACRKLWDDLNVQLWNAFYIENLNQLQERGQ